jgi:hypothetical protein
MDDPSLAERPANVAASGASPATVPIQSDSALSPFKSEEWCRLAPGERLKRAWALRSRLTNPRDVHDRKLFPAP